MAEETAALLVPFLSLGLTRWFETEPFVAMTLTAPMTLAVRKALTSQTFRRWSNRVFSRKTGEALLRPRLDDGSPNPFYDAVERFVAERCRAANGSRGGDLASPSPAAASLSRLAVGLGRYEVTPDHGEVCMRVVEAPAPVVVRVPLDPSASWRLDDNHAPDADKDNHHPGSEEEGPDVDVDLQLWDEVSLTLCGRQSGDIGSGDGGGGGSQIGRCFDEECAAKPPVRLQSKRGSAETIQRVVRAIVAQSLQERSRTLRLWTASCGAGGGGAGAVGMRGGRSARGGGGGDGGGGGGGARLEWDKVFFRTNKTLGNTVVSESVRRNLLDDVRWFMDNERWYCQRGTPYRRGYVLHGPPGTGKTSLIKAIANTYRLDIFAVDMEIVETNDQFADLVRQIHTLVQNNLFILCLEDMEKSSFVRRVGRKRPKRYRGGGGGRHMRRSAAASANNNGNNNDSDGEDDEEDDDLWNDLTFRTGRKVLTLSGFLNALDGVAEMSCLLFVTTNNVRPLRRMEAFMRPGRIDREVEVGYCAPEQFEGIMRLYYEDESIGLPRQIARASPAEPPLLPMPRITPANLIEVIQHHREAPRAVCAELVRLAGGDAATLDDNEEEEADNPQNQHNNEREGGGGGGGDAAAVAATTTTSGGGGGGGAAVPRLRVAGKGRGGVDGDASEAAERREKQREMRLRLQKRRAQRRLQRKRANAKRLEREMEVLPQRLDRERKSSELAENRANKIQENLRKLLEKNKANRSKRAAKRASSGKKKQPAAAAQGTGPGGRNKRARTE